MRNIRRLVFLRVPLSRMFGAVFVKFPADRAAFFPAGLPAKQGCRWAAEK